MGRAFRSFFFAVVCLVAGTWLLCSPRDEQPTVAPGVGGAASAAVDRSSPTEATAGAGEGSGEGAAPASRIGFRSRQRLEEHFAKHGAEFNVPTADAYLSLAQQLRNAPPGNDVLEITRPADGVVSKFDRRSGAFLAFDPDSTIRTFFKPNDGEAYFRRQARRTPRT